MPKRKKTRKGRKTGKVRKTKKYFGGKTPRSKAALNRKTHLHSPPRTRTRSTSTSTSTSTSRSRSSSATRTKGRNPQKAVDFLNEIEIKSSRQDVKNYLNKNINSISQAKRNKKNWNLEKTDHENIVDFVHKNLGIYSRDHINNAVAYWLECNGQIKKKSCDKVSGCVGEDRWASDEDENAFSHVGCEPLVPNDPSPPALGATKNLTGCTCRHKH